ncbi:Putative odorant-binding protein A10 [Cyphomyrmex costatus]|uniref:Putative odorant-binding protein A10 n=1 Tax=Cyphomyrmex costatus TaxID=456900 RepID=A0A195C9K6_9HYME|nr:Putative odorant-binding protein A10 [Cyphomyrmex costatus]
MNFHLGISFSQARNQATHSQRITYGRRDAGENMESTLSDRAHVFLISGICSPICELLITPRCSPVVCGKLVPLEQSDRLETIAHSNKSTRERRTYTHHLYHRILVLACAACALLATAMAAESDGEGQQSGRSRVSDEQLNMALSDKRYLNRQLKCALGEAPCDPVGRRLKSLVPLVLRGSCPQCSPEETRQIKKVLSHIQRSFPKEWNRIVQQYAGVL